MILPSSYMYTCECLPCLYSGHVTYIMNMQVVYIFMWFRTTCVQAQTYGSCPLLGRQPKRISHLTTTEQGTICSHICPLTLTSPIHPASLTPIVSSVSISLTLTLSSVCFYTSFLPHPHSLFICCHSPPSLLPSHVLVIVSMSSTLIDPLPPSLLVSNLICCYWPSQLCFVLPPSLAHIPLSLSLLSPGIHVSLRLSLME